MNSSLLETLLKCPFCGGQFNGTGTDGVSGRMEYGILSCYCSRFPVVAGIPVLKREKASEKAIPLIEDGRYLDALLTLIQPGSIPMPPMRKLASCLPFGSRLRDLAQQKMLQEWRERMSALLLRVDQGERVTVCELLDCYFSNKEHYNYFAFRFGQPRYLVALSFVSLIRQPKKMILDLGCGQGHITRSLVHQAKDRRVIGVDRSFWSLYVAKRWVAPEGEYVCCSADHALPFADKVFSAVFSSDAFHYIVNKRACVQELNRITDEPIIILTWLHNKLLRVPHDGVPLPPEGYQALFSDVPHRIMADEDILDRYLRKEGPNLSTQAETAFLSQKLLLSIVAATPRDVFCDYGPFVEAHHAKGRLGINPLYEIQVVECEIGKICLRRRFLSRPYEEDHAEYKNYMPEKVELDSSILRDIAGGKRTPAIEKLIEQFIVLGIPDNFYSDPQPASVVSAYDAVSNNA